MIEVVGGAVTVMQVMEKDFNSKRLHSWIKEHNAPTFVAFFFLPPSFSSFLHYFVHVLFFSVFSRFFLIF